MRHGIRSQIACSKASSTSAVFGALATRQPTPRLCSTLQWNTQHLEELTTTQQVKALMDGRIQVGLIRSSPQGEGIEWEVIASERMVLALPPRHRLADSGDAVHLREVAKDPFVLFPRSLGPGFYDQIIAACHAAGFSPEIAQEAIQMQTIVGLVAAGLDIAVVPASMRHFRTESVIYQSILDDVPSVEMAVMWRTGDRSPVLWQFLDAARRDMLDVNP